ncbi:3'-5' exonuclease [Amycolatopsis sp. DG1A-15b]|uniref:3'-5' exonuclease n=1 Tax=Amycolatopsis sp. DG1A-15b TaxID=3052846 RepID=UPI00255BF2D2|nr:3'-5' exonuclease [Amycolatopsis sp. DG1A-15b]WIX85733.1 3'-5' exonuclease [Amycolatopsis sp. DG1A-15b]
MRRIRRTSRRFATNSPTQHGSMTSNRPESNGATVSNHTAAWTEAKLVAIDLEGSGPQDPAGEAILEIALVPIHHGAPDLDHAFSSLINPERKITRSPWTSPGITNAVLEHAPTLDEVAPKIIELVAGAWLVGHNVRVDWRLLTKTLPTAEPVGLIDTLRLAKHRRPELKKGHGLQAWIERLDLTDTITQAARDSQPHRALWDTVATATLLEAFMRDQPATNTELDALLTIAGLDLDGNLHPTKPADQQSLFDSL